MSGSSVQTLRVAMRGSRLARVQADIVVRLITDVFPHVRCGQMIVSTLGDEDRDTPLNEIGTPGVFTKGVNQALRAGDADIAVHSLKDLPIEDEPGIVTAAIPHRGNPLDVALTRTGIPISELSRGCRVGTSSARRSAQLKFAFAGVYTVPLRGNVDTRVQKLRAGEFDAIVLAAAGLERIGHEFAATAVLSASIMLPAPGQGALAVQCRSDDEDVGRMLATITDERASAESRAERAFLAGMGGGCTLPIGALARVEGDRLTLEACVTQRDGADQLRVESSGSVAEPSVVGTHLAREAIAGGAMELLS